MFSLGHTQQIRQQSELLRLLCLGQSRGHSRNGPKGGRNPLNFTPRHVVLTIFLSFCSQKVQKPLQRTSLAVFRTKLNLMRYIVWKT